ncbi:MAG: 50S ribosomal protein L23 [Gammaproteobacteria bacterium]|nr:50S ribosomal protein L23 [Gammaproteobacteria bacterium]
MNEQRLMKVILAPLISEKSSGVSDKNNQYVFKTVVDATKAEIKAAIELLFSVGVTKVTVANVKGKVKRFRNKEGKRKDWKKAYVTLKAGQEIDLLGGADFS